MIQAQNVQQPPQGVTAELYSQLEDYLALGRLDSDIGKEDSQQKTTRRVIKKKSSRQQEEESSATSSGTLSIQVNGEVIRGSASEIIGRMVEAEMGPTFQEEALKAQAVAAYTYVRYHNQRGTSPSVVAKDTVSNEVQDAVDQVIGEAIYYDGEYINATFCASNAGQSMDAEHVWGGYLPYLVSVESPGDTTLKAYGATESFSEEEIADYIADYCGVNPYSYGDPEDWFSDPEYINGHYVDSILVCGQQLSGREVRENLLEAKINSAAFEVDYSDGVFTFTTYGYGHGVGMSQQGADYYAMQGWDYVDILTHYYTGTTVR